MSGQIAGEGWFMLHSFLLGAGITLFYDLFRILRRVIPHRTLLLSLEDLIFWVLATAGIFYLLYYENNGMFRWFAVTGAGLGMLVYRKTLSGPLVELVSSVINAVLAFLAKLIWKLLSPARFLLHKCRLLAGRAARRYARRLRAGHRRINSRLTAWRKAYRMKKEKGRGKEGKSHRKAGRFPTANQTESLHEGDADGRKKSSLS